jgi:hypothetical protein
MFIVQTQQFKWIAMAESTARCWQVIQLLFPSLVVFYLFTALPDPFAQAQEANRTAPQEDIASPFRTALDIMKPLAALDLDAGGRLQIQVVLNA